MDSHFTILALCAGGGGLERAVRLVIPSSRVVAMVEREAFAIECLAHQVETDGVGPVALWPDLLTFNGNLWRGLIDMLTAGIPCQPHSVAGKRLGAADERNLWPACERVIREVEPGFVFLENVGGSVAFFGEHVIGGLERLGYDVEAGLFEAAEVGARHQRQRLFVLAYHSRERCLGGDAPERSGQGEGVETTVARRGEADVAFASGAGTGHHGEAARRRDGASSLRQGHGEAGTTRPEDAGGDVADAQGSERRGSGNQDDSGRGASQTGGHGGKLADAGSAEHPQRQGVREDDGEERAAAPGSGLPLFPPGPADLEAWAEVLRIDPTLEPAICGMADGLASRADRLRMLGNGVVPLEAAYAFCTLLARLGARHGVNV